MRLDRLPQIQESSLLSGISAPPPSPREESVFQIVASRFFYYATYGAITTLEFCRKRYVDWTYQAPVFEKKAYDLQNPDEVVEFFERDSASALIQALELFKTDPKSLESMLFSLPVAYNKTRESRQGLISQIDKIFFGIIVSEKLRYFLHLFEEESLSEKILVALTGEATTVEEKSAAKLYQEQKNTQQTLDQIWEHCYHFICENFDLEGMNFENHDQYAITIGESDSPKITLGNFLERLLFIKDYRSLNSEETFELFLNLVYEVLADLQMSGDNLISPHSKLKEIVQKICAVLENQEQRAKLYNLVCKIIDHNNPSPKKSPNVT